jgi:hypothetical protein
MKPKKKCWPLACVVEVLNLFIKIALNNNVRRKKNLRKQLFVIFAIQNLLVAQSKKNTNVKIFMN